MDPSIAKNEITAARKGHKWLGKPIKGTQSGAIFVFGGTNDSWADAPLGEEQYEDFHHEDLFCVLPAICYFMGELRRNHPTARVVFIANCDIKPEIVEGMQKAAARLGADCIVLHGIDKECGHPTVRGMAQICEQVLAGLRE